MLADPGERLEGAAGGAAGGAVLSKAFRGAANLATKGITDVIPEAKRLYRLTREVDPKTKKVVGEGMFIPLSQSASNNIVKMVYNTFMANLPWAGGVIRGQRDDAVNAFRNFAGHKAIPDGITVPDEYVVKPSDSIDLVVDKVTRFWDEHAYSDVKALQNLKALKFDTPTPPSWLIDEVAKQSKKTLAPFKPGQTFTGEEFINLKRTISEIMPRLSKSLKPEAVRYQQQLDDLLKKNLVGGKRPNKQGRYSGGMADVWENYRTLGEHWPEANAFIKAAQSGPDFTNKALARSTHSITTNPQAKGPIQRGAADTLKGLENFPSKQGAFVTLATTGALGHMFAGMTGASAAIVGGIIAGRIGVSQGLQKFLSGQTRKQALTRIARKKYRKELAAAGMAARDIAIVMGSQDAS
jgi:hypothetical protein